MNKVPSTLHNPVLVGEVLRCLSPADQDVVIDGTFGAGGYTRAILKSAKCRVVAIDRDPRAIGLAKKLKDEMKDRLIVVEGRFSDLDQHAHRSGFDSVDGVVLDVGVSSMQLDEAERGFSFQKDGPLDMRMSGEGETAADLVNTLSEKELADIIYHYGDEPKSRRIARAIVEVRKEHPIKRTLQLANIVEKAIGFKRTKGAKAVHPATKTFQALRIAINEELSELKKGLEAAERILDEGGRLCVVSFHSLEDRIVKSFLLERSGNLPQPSRHLPDVPGSHPNPTFTLPGRGAIKPDDEEIAANPRARSARLRVAVRTSADPWQQEGGQQ